MSLRSAISRLAFACLLLALASLACRSAASSDAQPAASPTPEDLTADQVLELASSAARAMPSYRMTGETNSTPGGVEPETGTITAEWTAPDRMHQIGRTDGDSGPYVSEMIAIGDQAFMRNGPEDQREWQEVSLVNDPGYANSLALNSLDLGDASLVGVEEPDGKSVYRVEGVPQSPGADGTSDALRLVSAKVTVFINKSDFLPTRIELTQTYEWSVGGGAGSPNGDTAASPTPSRFTITMNVDVTFLSEPLQIDPPESYTPVARDDSAPYTPTPVVTPTPRPPVTLSPNDPNRNLPLFLNDTPDYDKLDLGNGIVVSYPPCDPNSILDRWAYIVIHTVPDGSRAANGSFSGLIVDAESGSFTARPDYLEFNEVVYQSDEGRAALEAVLSDPDLVSQVLEHAAIPARCPARFVEVYRERFDSVPDYDKLVIDDDTVALFQSCDTDYDNLVAPAVIEHFPTGSTVGVTPGEPGYQPLGAGTPSGYERLRQVVEDEALMSQIADLAPREARCG